MKTISKQTGFFSLGISLLILAIGGTAAAIKTTSDNTTTKFQQTHHNYVDNK